MGALALSLLVACAQRGDGEVGALELGDSADTSETAEDTVTGDDEASTTAGVPDLPAQDCGEPPCEACVCVDEQWLCNCAGLGNDAGFVELPPRDHALGPTDGSGPTQDSTTAPARMFWAMQAAEFGADDRPVFVFFNGGPGVSSGMLLGLNIGQQTFAPLETGPDETVAPNPNSWAALGTLVWIDARHTGFSHGLLPPPADVSDAAQRNAAMDLSSFNAYVDAADFVRVLLELFEQHPSLADNPVVLVAESYGGTRAQLMLDMLLQPQAYAEGSRPLVDPALAEAVLAHHLALHPELEGEAAAVSPELAAEQFGRQVLIQPALTGVVQRITAGEAFEGPDSPLLDLAEELGVPYQTCAELGGACNPYGHAHTYATTHDRSPYDTRSPASWLVDILDLVALRLNATADVDALLGLDTDLLDALPQMSAAERGPAWRSVSTTAFTPDAQAGDWPDLGGELQPWDRYFVTFHHEVFNEFDSSAAAALGIDPIDEHFGERFLTNLAWVDTLITQTPHDLVVYTPALPAAFETYAMVSEVEVEVEEGPEGDARWHVSYSPGAVPQRPELDLRTITAPRYTASHAISADAPEKFLADVEAWLELD